MGALLRILHFSIFSMGELLRILDFAIFRWAHCYAFYISHFYSNWRIIAHFTIYQFFRWAHWCAFYHLSLFQMGTWAHCCAFLITGYIAAHLAFLIFISMGALLRILHFSIFAMYALLRILNFLFFSNGYIAHCCAF